jgi:hypothetical protein
VQNKESPHVIERFEDFGERTRVLLEKYEEYIPSFGHLLLYYKSQEERMVIETEKVKKYGLQSFLEGDYDQAHARDAMLGCIAFAIVFSQLAESQRNILIRHSVPVFTYEVHSAGSQVGKEEALQRASREFKFDKSAGAEWYREWSEKFAKTAQANRALLNTLKLSHKQ